MKIDFTDEVGTVVVMSQSERSQRLLTAAQVAAELCVSRSTVYAWVRSGDIEFVRFGPQRKPGQRGRGGAIRFPARVLDQIAPETTGAPTGVATSGQGQ